MNEGQELHRKTAPIKPRKIDDVSAIKSADWFICPRSPDALELIRANPNAYTLAAFIGYRARYREGFNADGLGLGDAMLGDFKSCGMTRQQYRTALDQLIKWRFVTTRPTTKGTVARLADIRLFEILPIQATTKITNAQPPANHRATTNIDGKIDISVNNEAAKSARPDLQTVKLQAAKIGLPDNEAEKFFNYYQANGWKVGRNPMRSLPHALANWKLRWAERARPAAVKPHKASPTSF